ncbi:hypothetical protein EFK68_04395 [Pseudomonas aeruginosa]|nr:hypothetical protein EFK68_04395 [Pseudomonas aeruginosa]
MLRSIAALGKALKPGLIVLGVTLVSYWLLRVLMPEKSLAAPLVYAIGILLSVVMLIKGFSAWFERLETSVDSPDARARFIKYLDQVSSGVVPPASAEFSANAEQMKGRELADSFDGCWAFDLSVGKFPAYDIEGYLLLSEQQLCLGLIGGVKGGWHETRHAYAPCEREGSTLTVISSFGSLDWLPPGSQLTIDYDGGEMAQLTSRAVVARMKRSSVPESLKRFIPTLSAP